MMVATMVFINGVTYSILLAAAYQMRVQIQLGSKQKNNWNSAREITR